MDFKKLLKRVNLSENYGSTILGFIVVLILGSFIFNVFRGNRNDQQGQVGEEGTTSEETTGEIPAEGKTHTVAKGEDLWKISEQYYKSGYNWVDIAKANNLSNPNDIEEGQKLTIPPVTPIVPTVTAKVTATAVPTKVQPTEVPAEQGEKGEEMPTPTVAPTATTTPSAAQGTYAVQHGDNLWNIAVAKYNNGYKWVDIARANGLKNPNIIHAGNVLKLP
ncbi:LysM peptidoglycan-binding domain-containing protein [Candidatus Roizmanbacteria bacterium]|nr:LysM peptidoglycan-binding domain-containing protein [Candidatus Roizmanbacteria bacterium]